MSEELRAYLMARRRALLQEVRWIEEALGLKGGQAEGLLRRPPARNDNGGRDDNVALSNGPSTNAAHTNLRRMPEKTGGGDG